MRTVWASLPGRLGASLLAVILCALMVLPAQAITSNSHFTPAVPVPEKTAYSGVLVVVVKPCTGLFCQNDPIMGRDPSGHDPDCTLVSVESASSWGEQIEATCATVGSQGIGFATKSLVYKVGAFAILGGAVAGQIGMLLGDLGPAPQQQYFEQYKNREYGIQYKCVAYSDYFRQENPQATFVAFRIKESEPDEAPYNAIMARSGALFDQNPQTAISINGFHMGAVLGGLVFDNNSLGSPLSLWGENYWMAKSPDPMSEHSMNEAVRMGFGEMRLYNNWGDVPHSRHNLDGKWDRGISVSY